MGYGFWGYLFVVVSPYPTRVYGRLRGGAACHFGSSLVELSSNNSQEDLDSVGDFRRNACRKHKIYFLVRQGNGDIASKQVL
ncbi:MAG: hypothetical protein ACYSSM_07470, partial [Planctomycetota bacterium]